MAEKGRSYSTQKAAESRHSAEALVKEAKV